MSAPDPTCPQCGTRLKPGVPGGLCLRCLLSFGLKEETAHQGEESSVEAASAGSSADGFDRFRIIEKLGEGGCGVVYHAEQSQPIRREVALKVIKLGMDTGTVIARFEAERQALAMMDHPGIAKIFDAGTSRQGRPFFAMELVAGERITDYCDQRQLSIPQRLELFARVCEAVQHAHQKGIIHRDLKPSNILVTELDGMAQPKVIDFGIAKATSRQRLADQTIYTAFNQFIGTPAYMSPEQAGATGEDVDTRSDIYSLGVLLYELLTGRPPFEPERLRQAAVDEIFRIIRDEEPARPSSRLTTLSVPELSEVSRLRLSAPPRLVRELRGDLDWVVMKALEKLPARRYETANALAVEIRRHLNHEPVIARPPNPGYRFQKMVRRNKLAFAAATSVVLALNAGLAVSTWRFFKEQEARQAAVAAERKARAEVTRAEQIARFLKDMLAGVGPSVALGRDTAMLRDILDRTAERVGLEMTGNPEIRMELCETMGRTYYDLKLLDRAEAMHRTTLALREAHFGATDAAVVASLIDLGTVLNTRARLEDLLEAESLLRRARRLGQLTWGETNLTSADCLQTLAWNLFAQKKWAESEGLYRQALAIRRKWLRPNDPALIPPLLSLGRLLLHGNDRLDEATEPILEAIKIQQLDPVKAKPAAMETFRTLGDLLVSKGRPAEAEAAIREAIALQRKYLGGDNEVLGETLNQLAFMLWKQGKFAEAEQASRESLVMLEKFRSRNHPSFANYLLGMFVQILKDQGKWADAEAPCREWVGLLRKPGGSRETLLTALHWHGLILSARRNWDQAAPALQESIELCGTLHEAPRLPGSTRCSGLRRMLGETMLRLGRHEEAEALLLSSYSELKDNNDYWVLIDCRKALLHLVELYETTARPAEAAAWKQKLAEFQKAQPAKTNPAPRP